MDISCHVKVFSRSDKFPTFLQAEWLSKKALWCVNLLVEKEELRILGKLLTYVETTCQSFKTTEPGSSGRKDRDLNYQTNTLKS